MKGFQSDSPKPECYQFGAQIVIQDSEETCRDKFAEDVPQNINNIDPFIEYNFGQFLTVNFITIHR